MFAFSPIEGKKIGRRWRFGLALSPFGTPGLEPTLTLIDLDQMVCGCSALYTPYQIPAFLPSLFTPIHAGNDPSSSRTDDARKVHPCLLGDHGLTLELHET